MGIQNVLLKSEPSYFPSQVVKSDDGEGNLVAYDSDNPTTGWTAPMATPFSGLWLRVEFSDYYVNFKHNGTTWIEYNKELKAPTATSDLTNDGDGTGGGSNPYLFLDPLIGNQLTINEGSGGVRFAIDEWPSEIKQAYESNANTNAFTDVAQTKVGYFTDLGGYLKLINSDDDLLPALVLEKNRSVAETGSKPLTLLVQNLSEVSGGNDHQNETILGLKAGVSSNHRRYVGFIDYNDQFTGYFGQNGSNALIMYNAVNQTHMLFANSITSGGNFQINSVGTGAISFNQYASGEQVGTGGIKFFDGVVSRNQFATFLNGNTTLGYDTAATPGYRLNIGGATYASGQNGGIAVQAPNSMANYSTYQGIRVFDATAPSNGFTVGIRTSMNSGTSKYNVYADGTAINYFNGNVGIKRTNPTTELDINGNLTLRGYHNFVTQFATDGSGVGNNTLFLGTDGNLYFKNGSGTTTQVN